MNVSTDTICALSTPVGRSAIAVIRISGPKVTDVYAGLFGGVLLPAPKVAELKTLVDKAGSIIDEVVCIYFKAPKSFTGEDILEIHCHGNPAIVERILAEIVSRETRLAEPGEFTRRALANGKMSLSGVEAMDWVLNSKTFEGAKAGLAAKMGTFGQEIDRVRIPILDLLVEVQGQLDFSDFEVGALDENAIKLKLEDSILAVERWVNAYDSSRHHFSQPIVVLAGPPNSGKSSLFNSITGTERSIVFDQPGTTRDSIEASVMLGGQSALLVDTAGIRESPDPVEGLGIEKTMFNIGRADLIVWASERVQPPDALLERFADKKWIFAQTKADTSGSTAIWSELRTSSKTGFGVDKLRSLIASKLPSLPEGVDSLTLTSVRQRALAVRAVDALKSAVKSLELREPLDILADKILSACKNLDEITGGIPTEDVLSEIFKRFCIGK